MHLITAQRDQILLLMTEVKGALTTYSAVWRSVELVFDELS